VIGQNNNHWYAVRVRSRHEASVARHLSARGLEAFLPMYQRRNRWSDRVKTVDFPLFPGYVFCHFNVEQRLPLLSVPGVVHVVGLGKIPAPIDEDEIVGIRSAVKAGLYREPCPYLYIGKKVRIAHGPLSGVEGILVGVKGHERLILSITLLQRSVAVEIDEDWVEPASPQLVSSTQRASWQSVG
jgi:transcription antitermination factor NusG